ncbi:MAG: transposase, IS4 [Parcubacteria group bacterium Gr01-1014_66]|nr:MAG: transposase, IS4 [Parcubacteria group bacterium Gr01-1014_66]
MIKYTTLRQRPNQFLSFTGLNVEEFDRLSALIRSDWIIQRAEKLHKGNPSRKRTLGAGRKCILETLEDQLLLTLVWSRLSLVYFVLEHLFGIDESTVSRTIQRIHPLLQDRFMLPERLPKKKIRTIQELKEFLPPDITLDDILVDGTEQAIPRPEKKRLRTAHHSGKKKRFTVKTQIATTRNGLIVHVSKPIPGRTHDYKLFKASILPQIIPKESRLYGDSGYQGIQKDYPHLHSVIPRKRTRNHTELTRSEKIRNTKQRKIRVKVEHAFSRLKKYRALADTYRHSLQNYNQTFRFIANVVNFRMMQRAQAV